MVVYWSVADVVPNGSCIHSRSMLFNMEIQVNENLSLTQTLRYTVYRYVYPIIIFGTAPARCCRCVYDPDQEEAV